MQNSSCAFGFLTQKFDFRRDVFYLFRIVEKCSLEE